ncbi:class E sortase [Arcanobacterium haemolyticum]
MTHEPETPGEIVPPRRRSALPREARIYTGTQPAVNTDQNLTQARRAAKFPPVGVPESQSQPKPPHKKRNILSAIIGVIGELLITFGLIVAGFIVWQLWWTSILANQAQTELLDEFAKKTTAAPTVAAEPVKKDPPPFELNPTHGQMFGVIHFPSFGKSATRSMAEGTTNWDILDHGGFGHYEGTAWPGEIGNFSLAAHRRGNGDALMFVEEFKPGDPIIVETETAYYVYKMTDHELVTPDKTRVIQPDPYQAREAEENGTGITAPTKRLITLTTCHPQYNATHRWIVHGEFDSWISKSEGMPKELIELNKKEG